ncbi:uncharacterized protein LOC129599120 [Paramacrobiotus metropolitanus]|uniref:uncharacterized protein LOC129599120 n=1 Tax=Paramacrobiotus metropolitanus TaxID=2943436 RepID=UPI002445BE38|nr:uncharacterized protein LOC129599120 [Paramacrobiotus metropolitanus]
MAFLGISMGLTFLTNGGVLAIFFAYRELRSPFSFYVMNLLCVNLYLAIANPMRIIDNMNTLWFPKTWACNFFIVNDWIGSAILGHAHLLITLNRVWAIMFPISYKHLHTRNMAKYICIGFAVYCHVMILPFILIDFIYYRGPTLNVQYCDVNVEAQGQYSNFLLYVFYQMPMFAVICAYPLLYWKSATARKVTVANGNTSKVPSGASAMDKTMDTRLSNTGLKPAKPVKQKDGTRKPFYVLTAMTLSVLICWGPTKVYNIIQNVSPWDECNQGVAEFRKIGEVLYAMQMFIDPVLFAMVLSDLRAVIGKLLQQLFCKS